MKNAIEMALLKAHEDPIFQALDPRGRQFLRGNVLPSGVVAMRAYGELSHIKCVAAFQMMLEECQSGCFVDKHTIVVDSSGNTAESVARLAPAYGFKSVKVVVSSDVPASKRDIFSAMSTVELISVSGGKSVAARAVEEAKNAGHYHLNQYALSSNAHAHELYTGPEIARVLDNNVGIIAIAMGSGGTATGIARYLRKKFPRATVIGVRPKIGEPVPGARDKVKMEAVVPPMFRPRVDHIVDDVLRKEAFTAARYLSRFVEPRPGPTSGLAYVGLEKYREYLESVPLVLELMGGNKSAFLCPDSALLYSDVIIAELDTGQGV